jgi:uncharacterized protein
VKQHANGYVSNRILKLNVGFLLTGGSGHSHETVFDVPPIRVSDDLDLLSIRGPIRLSRTKEGILVQGQLQLGIEDECYRCLDTVNRDLTVNVEELYAYPPKPDAEFSIGDDAILDLAPIIRAESFIQLDTGVLCSDDCKGLCPDCGTNWNHATCTCAEQAVDPRMAKLKELLDKN